MVFDRPTTGTVRLRAASKVPRSGYFSKESWQAILHPGGSFTSASAWTRFRRLSSPPPPPLNCRRSGYSWTGPLDLPRQYASASAPHVSQLQSRRSTTVLRRGFRPPRLLMPHRRSRGHSWNGRVIKTDGGVVSWCRGACMRKQRWAARWMLGA